MTESIPSTHATIVADPPWSYLEGWPEFGDRAGMAHSRRPLPYPAMTVAEIRALPVADLAETDAHLFLWTTNRYLTDAYDVARAWGFRPSQLLTWCKPPIGIGPGGAFSQTTEFVVYARRGRPRASRRIETTWWQWSRRGGHSAKPEAFLDMVESAFPGPYLELFARRNRLGWSTWGNESLEHIEVAT
jgi:N6-adenosine-specific RNA methylase IME4